MKHPCFQRQAQDHRTDRANHHYGQVGDFGAQEEHEEYVGEKDAEKLPDAKLEEKIWTETIFTVFVEVQTCVGFFNNYF